LRDARRRAQRAAFDQVVTTAVLTALVPAAAGALLVAVGWILQARPRPSVSPLRARRLTLAATGAALAGMLAVPVAAGPSAPRVCEGHAWLCDRSYDQVADLTSHNANSTTVDRLI
jgi:hypothetical protein